MKAMNPDSGEQIQEVSRSKNLVNMGLLSALFCQVQHRHESMVELSLHVSSAAA